MTYPNHFIRVLKKKLKNFMSKEIEQEKKEIIKDKITTAVSKVKFISEIKSGLGAEIKKNPKKIKIIEKTRGQKLLEWFKKIFTKF